MSAVNNSINNTSYSFSTIAGLTVGNALEVTLGGALIDAGGLTVTLGATTLTPLAGTNGGMVKSSTAGVLSHVENPTTNGQLLISKNDGSDPIWASLTPGTGISITPGANSISIATTGGSYTWSVTTISVSPMVTLNAYFANGVGLLSFALPTTAAVGDRFQIVAMAATGWTVTQSSGQQIFFGTGSTTSGATGTISSSAIGDKIELVCSVANNSFIVVDAIGNLTLA